jgi:lipopolysaccharide/colanic/teichoic acid biosynthesis glycosyltransferase
MKVNKENCIIINPGVLTIELLSKKKFKDKYEVITWRHDRNNLNDLETKLLNGPFTNYVIYLDEIDNTEIEKEILGFLNKLRVGKSSIMSLSELYEKFFFKTPVKKIRTKWRASKELLNLKISFHIDFFKRIFDLLISFFIAPVAITFTILGAILIKLTSKGPILFKQERVGKNGIPFNIIKLRTMIYNPDGHSEHTVINDQRIFPIGLFLRTTKIDELPQLFNILKGDMSLIGPRPERKEIVGELSIENPYYELRHLIRPGITGWAQVNNPIATPNESFEKLEYDLYYIKNASFVLDMTILLKTVRIIINRNSL